MAMVDDKQLLDVAAQRIAGARPTPRGAPVTPQALEGARLSLRALKSTAGLRVPAADRQTAFVVITRATDINTDRAFAAFLGQRPEVAKVSLAPVTLYSLLKLDSALATAEHAATLAQAGFMQVVIDEGEGFDPVIEQLLALFARTDLKTELFPGVSVGVAQVALGETRRVLESLSQSATDRAQRDERRLKQAAEQVDAAAKAAAAEAKVAQLKQAAREGVAVPQKKPPRSKKGA